MQKPSWKKIKLEKSLLFTIIAVLLLFILAITVVVISPNYVDKSWTSPCCSYQVQMYEVSDPNTYINGACIQPEPIEIVKHIKSGDTLLAFKESDNFFIVAPKELEKYVTKSNEIPLKLTSTLLFLREPITTRDFDAVAAKQAIENNLQKVFDEKLNDDEKSEMPFIQIKELYKPLYSEGFSVGEGHELFENWVDRDFVVIDPNSQIPRHFYEGVIYIKNPQEYRIGYKMLGSNSRWQYDDQGVRIKSIQELTSEKFGFVSRKNLIEMGEDIYRKEGCWYCHTDQTRTLVEDTVVNGSAFYPAPPSSANEYIYQKISFLGTKRNGPDISRIGVKTQSRDWHKSHFWNPRNKSSGSIMPAFKHFFNYHPDEPITTTRRVPNCNFEAIYQYLMTKGTRITAPNEAWWLGYDPIKTIDIISGRQTQKQDQETP